MVRPAPTGLRCAIYTRKSSEEGLDQAFNSLHAQREACAAYVTSQRHQGWQLIETAYDDGGLSGGTMARPALQRLLAEIEGRRIDIVLVYKVDRLTRSLADFARIIETFDAHDVSFVSITQQFNTTTSMGRLTLNMLLSFAQFEREVTGERIRDKIAASRARGLWMGGHVPLGYDLEARCLVANPDEAAIVRLIFARYVELGSVASLKAELDARGIVSKARISATGKSFGGKSFSRGALYRLLANRVYIGQAVHKGRAHPGAHAAIIERALFEAAQTTLSANRITRTNGYQADEPSLLGGLLVDAQGERMSPSHAVKNRKRYRYYVSQALLQQRTHRTGQEARIPAHEIEALVVSELQALLHDPGALLDLLSRCDARSGRATGAASRGGGSRTALANARAGRAQRVRARDHQAGRRARRPRRHCALTGPSSRGLAERSGVRRSARPQPALPRRADADRRRPPQALRWRDQADRPSSCGRHAHHRARTRP